MKKKNLMKRVLATSLALSMCIAPTITKASVEKVERISGRNRIETSVNISKSSFESSDNVVIANGFDFPDALSSGQLAAALNAPLLLSSSDKLDTETKSEIERLNPKNVYIVGGEKALNKERIEPEIKSITKNAKIERLAGRDRYDTSVKVMEKTKEFVDPENLLIVSGNNFPDALAAAGYMASHKSVMVLSDGVNYPKSELNEVAIGGKNLLPLNGFTGERISGKDRYETALEIAKKSFTNNDTAILSNANVFADSLSAVSLTKKYNAPIILTSNKNLNKSSKDYLNGLKKIVIVGGKASVEDNILQNKTIEELAVRPSKKDTKQPQKKLYNFEKAVVERVVDGDTIVVKRQNGVSEKIRMVLVNTPETKHPKKGVEYFGKEASAYTKKMLPAGKTVYLEKDVSERDRYSRLLRYVWINEPTSKIDTKVLTNNCFNAMLLANGFAQVSVFPPDVKYVNEFRQIEKTAKDNNVGLWKGGVVDNNTSTKEPSNEQTKPVDRGVIRGNRKSKIYHMPGQASYDKISDKNLVLFETEQDAINAGYRKAKR